MLFFKSKNKKVDMFSDEDFDRELSEYNEWDEDRKERAGSDWILKVAYRHRSVKSAFWWYEHTPNKPNTGSDRDVELLHVKFKHSLESHNYGYDTRKVTKEVQEKFLMLVLPDIDYSVLGYHGENGKEQCMKKIMEQYEAQKQFKHENRMLECYMHLHASPFLTGFGWTVYHLEEVDGEDENGNRDVEALSKKLSQKYSKWFVSFFPEIWKKYSNGYSYIDFPDSH